MSYVLGVDGGQTSTSAVLMDENGHVLGRGRGGPANHIHEPGGAERVRQSLADAVSAARGAAGLPDAPIACAYLGMTGLAPELDAICSEVIPAERILLGHDTRVALFAVTLGGPGVVVIAGTGSVAFGRDTEGRETSVGGWGYLMGDEGSAYWIGVRALNCCARAHDGLEPPTLILKCVLRHTGCASLRDVHRLVYGGELGRPAIAGLAPCVHEAAELGDPAAAALLAAAGAALGRQAAQVLAGLSMHGGQAVVGAVGGVFEAGEWVLEPMRLAVRASCPAAEVRRASVAPDVAAGLLALEAIGIRRPGIG